MAGKIKTGGRKAGTPNRNFSEMAAYLDSLGCNPIEGLARIANDERNSWAVRGQCYAVLARLVHPKLAAVETHSVPAVPEPMTGPAWGRIQAALIERGALREGQAALGITVG